MRSTCSRSGQCSMNGSISRSVMPLNAVRNNLRRYGHPAAREWRLSPGASKPQLKQKPPENMVQWFTLASHFSGPWVTSQPGEYRIWNFMAPSGKCLDIPIPYGNCSCSWQKILKLQSSSIRYWRYAICYYLEKLTTSILKVEAKDWGNWYPCMWWYMPKKLDGIIFQMTLILRAAFSHIVHSTASTTHLLKNNSSS